MTHRLTDRPDAATLADLRERILPIAAELGAWAQERSDDHYRGRGGVEVGFKISPRNLVTSVDLEVQRRLTEALAALAPGFGFIGEEDGLADFDPEQPLWVLDPIDGTHNFVRNYPGFCVAIALVHKRETLLGVIYDSATRLLYSAHRGGGAWRHAQTAGGFTSERIHVSEPRELARAMITTGFTEDAANSLDVLRCFGKLAAGSGGLRISGSAARDTCFVAAGKVDLFWQSGIRPWDVAPALVIVTEAGGTVELRHAGEDWLTASEIDIFAGAAELVECALEIAALPK